MATTIPTPASFSRKAKLVWFATINPQKFSEEEAADCVILNSQTDLDNTPRIYAIRSALAEAFLWCTGSLFTGFVIGSIAVTLTGTQTNAAIATVIAGTLILLWATLALQGWGIQSYGGVTLGERVNRWIFRLLYSFGTALIVAGSIWTLSS